MDRIEKRQFHPGEYVGYGGGHIWYIYGGTRAWRAYAQAPGGKYLQARTLRELNRMLAEV